MPITIPSYGQSEVAPTVTSQPRVSESAPLENFGGGQSVSDTGAAIQGLAKQTNDIFLEQKKAADNAIGQDVFAKLTQKKNALIYDPKAGAMTKKGQDALSVVGDYGQQFTDYADQVASTLSNDEQRAQFTHFRREVGDDLNSTLTKYTYGESQNLQNQIAETALKSAQDDAILNYHEPDKIQSSIDLQTNLLTNTLTKQGMPSEVIDQKVKEAKSTTLTGVVDRMLVNGQDIAAKAFYDQHKDSITAANAITLEKALETGSMRGESQRQSDKIVNDNDNLSDALDDARAIKDPKLRDETTKRVKEYFADQQTAQKTDDDNNFRDASDIIENNGGNLDQVPPQTLAKMSSSDRASLEKRATQKKNGVEPESNSEQFYDLQTMATTPELRDKFLGTNLLQYRHSVTQNEMSEMIKIQSSMRKSDGEADDTIRGLRSRTQVVNETLKSIGIDPKSSPEDYLAANRALDDQMAQFYSQHGKKPNGNEIQGMMDNIIVKTKNPNSGFFGFFQGGRAFNQDPNAQLTVDIDNIPVSEKNQIKQALQARHLPVTDDKIVELYQQKINVGRQIGR